MRKIIIDRKEIDFNGKIPLKFNSPIFNDELTHSLPFNITANIINNEILEFINDIDVISNSEIERECIIDSEEFILRGTLNHNKSSNNQYSCHFKGGNGWFNSMAKETKLTDIDLGYCNLGNNENEVLATMKDMLYNDEDYGMVFTPLKNDIFGGEDGFGFYFENGTINYYNIDAEAFQNVDETAFIPFLLLSVILRKIFETYGITLKKNIFDIDSDLRKLIIYNVNTITNYKLNDAVDEKTISAIEKGSTTTITFIEEHAWTYGFLKIKDVVGMEEINNKIFRFNIIDSTSIEIFVDSSEWSDYISGGSGCKYDLLQNIDNIVYLNNHLPGITIDDFFRGIENHLGVKFIIDESEKSADIISLDYLISNNEIIDISEYAADDAEIDHEKINGYKFTSESDSGDEYFSSLVQQFPENYQLKDAVATFDDLPDSENSNNDIRLVENENAYYIYSDAFLATEKNWNFLTKDLLLDYSEGDEELKIESKVSTLILDYDTNRWIPHADQKLNSNSLACLEKSEFSLRLLFYRGLQAVNVTPPIHYYPLTTYDIYQHLGQKLSDANLSLDFNGNYGIKEKRYKNYLHWYQNIRKPVSISINWPPYLLQNFDYAKKYRIRGNTYFVKTIPMTFLEDGQEFGKTELLKV